MKNKHLVLLFLTVLALGVLARFLPMPYRSLSGKNLLRYDPEMVTRVVLTVPEQVDLILTNSEHGWIAEQAGRTVLASEDQAVVIRDALGTVGDFDLIKTSRPDTLGFDAGHKLTVRFFSGKKLLDEAQIGWEDGPPDHPCTYIMLPAHEGVYRVPGRLRRIYQKHLSDFRLRTVAQIDYQAVYKVFFRGEKVAPTLYERNDSTGRWFCCEGLHSLSDDSMQVLLNLFERLEQNAFADFFDESREEETLCAHLNLVLQHGENLTLRFFRMSSSDLPEDLDLLRELKVRSLPAYVVHSSQNPNNYFSISDTNLLHFLRHGLTPTVK